MKKHKFPSFSLRQEAIDGTEKVTTIDVIEKREVTFSQFICQGEKGRKNNWRK